MVLFHSKMLVHQAGYRNSHQVAICTSCASEAKRLVQQKPPRWASGCTRNGQELFAQAKILSSLSSVRCLSVFWVKNSDFSFCFRENLLKKCEPHIRRWLSDSCPVDFPGEDRKADGFTKKGHIERWRDPAVFTSFTSWFLRDFWRDWLRSMT